MRKQSVFRPTAERNNLTAADLLPKLKLLYNIGMVTFQHHMDQRNFKQKTLLSQTTGKQDALQTMQFPKLNSWDPNDLIQDQLSQD